MSTSDEIRQGLQHGLNALAEGWYALRHRGAQALTHFAADRSGLDPSKAEGRLLHGASRWGLLAAEVREEADGVLVSVEIPGMRAEDFEIEVIGDVLVIRGEKRIDKESAGGRHFLLERAYGRFERVIHLPAEVDRNRVEAHYRNGVLSLSLPKRVRRSSYRVEVQKA